MIFKPKDFGAPNETFDPERASIRANQQLLKWADSYPIPLKPNGAVRETPVSKRYFRLLSQTIRSLQFALVQMQQELASTEQYAEKLRKENDDYYEELKALKGEASE